MEVDILEFQVPVENNKTLFVWDIQPSQTEAQIYVSQPGGQVCVSPPRGRSALLNPGVRSVWVHLGVWVSNSRTLVQTEVCLRVVVVCAKLHSKLVIFKKQFPSDGNGCVCVALQDGLFSVFSSFGPLYLLKVCPNAPLNPRGFYALIKFYSAAQALKAQQQIDGRSLFQSSPLKVITSQVFNTWASSCTIVYNRDEQH